MSVFWNGNQWVITRPKDDGVMEATALPLTWVLREPILGKIDGTWGSWPPFGGLGCRSTNP